MADAWRRERGLPHTCLIPTSYLPHTCLIPASRPHPSSPLIFVTLSPIHSYHDKMRGGVSADVEAMAERFNTRCAAACSYTLCPPRYSLCPPRYTPWRPAAAA